MHTWCNLKGESGLTVRAPYDKREKEMLVIWYHPAGGRVVPVGIVEGYVIHLNLQAFWNLVIKWAC